MSRPFPLVEYGHIIGKNTAEFTVNDLAAFMRWWLKQPVREDIVEATAAQRKVYEEDVAKMKQWREDNKMAKDNKYKNAQTSRLPVELTGENVEEEVVNAEEIICEMGLTKMDVEALKFAIQRCFADYELEGNEYGVSLKGLLEGLEGV